MDSEIKALWLKALRDPEKKQITGRLKSSEGCCASGVLCEIAASQGIVTEEIDEWGKYSFNSSITLVPHEVYDWAGLTSGLTYADKWLIPTDAVTEEEAMLLAVAHPHNAYRRGYTIECLNDAGLSFTRIADLIEEYL